MAVALGALVARGTRSTVYRWGNDAVAKVPLASTPDSWIRFESVYADAVFACGAPVPKMLGVEEVDGRLVSLWEYIDGDSLWESFRAGSISLEATAGVLSEIHTALHTIDPPVTLPRQQDRLLAKIRRCTDDSATTEDLPAGQVRLCHGDLHPGNVLRSRKGPKVIDWFDACRGTALGDIARTATLLATVTDSAHMPGATQTVLNDMRTLYLENMGIDQIETAEWSAWLNATRVARAGEFR
jgi:aminoglycoside phosphotransferase (APT) family kinase protein